MLIWVVLSRSLPRIRWSARAFARAPGLSLALLLTIALGVGSNAAVFAFLEGLVHPASYLRGSGRVVSVLGQDRSREPGALSPDDYRLVQSSHDVFEWIAAVRIAPVEATIDGHAEITTVAVVTPSLAEALAIPLGNGVVISHRIWESEFGARANAVGSLVRIHAVDLKIDGIAPDRLDGLYNDQSVDLWTQSQGQDLEGGLGKRDVWVLARLRQGVSMQSAQTALRSRADGLREVSVVPFTGIAPSMARGLARVGMFLRFSAAAVFFIACINVASFLLGRALKRSHETSLRIALGATASELLWELFADSVVISIAGGMVGVLLGIMTAHVLPVFLFEQDAERISFAPHVLPILEASLACIVLTVLCGMTPVLGTVTDRPWTVLQRETGSPSKALLRLRSGLVAGQITACCMLMISTAFLFASLRSALETSAGHRLGNPILLTVRAQMKPEVDINYFSAVEQRATSGTGLSRLAWTARLPGNQPEWRTFRAQRSSAQYRDIVLDIAPFTADSLQLLDSQPVAGRMFGINNQRYRVAIVDEEAAAQIFGPQTAGLVIRDSDDQPIEIIGVVQRRSKDAKQQARPTIYFSYLDRSDVPRPIKDARFRVPLAPPTAGIELNANVVSESYFRALDMPLIAGQVFPEHPIPGQGRLAVINQEAAALYFNRNALGTAVIDDGGVRTEIIGVVGSQVFGTFEQHAEPAIFFPMWQDCPPRMTLMLKPSKWNTSIAADFRRSIENVPGRGSPSIGISTLDTQLAQSGLAGLRIATLIGGVSAATALMLSILGLLSAQSDAERQRRRDRALQIALGAQRWRIVFMIVKNAARLAFVGSAAGILLSFLLLRLALADITEVTSPPFEAWLIAPLLAAGAVVIASVVSARRASVISPSVIMRDS